ncbi:MAG: hypothetical protein H0Z18_07935 [Thermococcus sp.]|uniref:prenyltransferase/squalene oxidase repeat-containing protein n=1 Tax=Thermococcus sp. TaxID=35749 RepID=UPI001E11F857|nr:prenyltransferase/squalene oxidase repeat-containing protein [Thermococcus sp.]MBO8175172.1 hypothetical protein [Thermococcus sp.]
MKRVAFIFILLIISTNLTFAAEVPNVWEPTTLETSFAVIGLYEYGDYPRVLEGCEWLNGIKTPESAWGSNSHSHPEAKYTAPALMALLRCESLASGRYSETINSAAYWLIYIQKDDGSFGDIIDTSLALLALKEYSKTKVAEIDVSESITRGEIWLENTNSQNAIERLLKFLALGEKVAVSSVQIEGENKAFKYFALSYLGEKVDVKEDFNSTLGIALALYASKSEKYHQKLLERQHFGFWGVKRFNTAEILDASKVEGFEELKSVGCHYMDMIKPKDDMEKVIFARYFLMCGKRLDLDVNLTKILPWMVAEIMMIKAEKGENYSKELNFLLSTQKDGIWKEFYNTAYVIWAMKKLNVDFDYNKSLEYLKDNLRTGYPTYYYAQALKTFYLFNMTEEVQKTLKILSEYQNPNGGFGYSKGNPSGIRSTALVLQALQEIGMKNEIYEKGWRFLRVILYLNIPEIKKEEDMLVLNNSAILMIKDSKFIGISIDKVNLDDLDGVVVLYKPKVLIFVKAVENKGFSPINIRRPSYKYVGLGIGILIVVLIFLKKR